MPKHAEEPCPRTGSATEPQEMSAQKRANIYDLPYTFQLKVYGKSGFPGSDTAEQIHSFHDKR